MRKSNRNGKVSPKSRSRKGAGSKGGGEGKVVGPDSKMIIWRPPPLKSQVVRRTFRYIGQFSSTAGGALGVQSPGCVSSIAALTTEFTNFAQEFQEFRCKNFELTLFPATTSATSVTGPYQIGVIAAPWWQFVPTTLASIEQSSQVKEFSSLYMEKVGTSGFKNSELWNAYGTTLPADRDFGVVFVGIGTFAASSVIFQYIARLVVEFRQAQ